MYRALAASALAGAVRADDGGGLLALARGLRYRLTEADPPELVVDRWDEAALTAPEVERTVSTVARHPAVRGLMRDAQRALGRGGAVMEGRDIGTVVFPDAAVKLFLRAEAGARVERRAEERARDGADIGEELRERDRRDARTNPLTPADGAVVLDTGALDASATLEAALAAVRAQAPELIP
jgi:cytidylate kinase